MVFIHPAIDRCLLQSRRGVISWHPDIFIYMFRARGVPDIHLRFMSHCVNPVGVLFHGTPTFSCLVSEHVRNFLTHICSRRGTVCRARCLSVASIHVSGRHEMTPLRYPLRHRVPCSMAVYCIVTCFGAPYNDAPTWGYPTSLAMPADCAKCMRAYYANAHPNGLSNRNNSLARPHMWYRHTFHAPPLSHSA